MKPLKCTPDFSFRETLRHAINPAVVLLHDALQGDANQAMFLMGQCRQFAQAVSHLDDPALDQLSSQEVEAIARRFRTLRRKIVAYIRRYDEPVTAANQLLALLKENPVLPGVLLDKQLLPEGDMRQEDLVESAYLLTGVLGAHEKRLVLLRERLNAIC